MSGAVHHGDCLEWLAGLPADSVDACVTDPPYGLGKPPPIDRVLRAWLAGEAVEVAGGGFMGRSWDAFIPGPRYWRAVWRVLKPGGHAVVFAGQRTVDVMGVALRLAGFEVRDCGGWAYWSGFPKSMSVGRAIDQIRDDRAEVLQVTDWIARARDDAGLTNQDIDAAFGFAGMAGHWTTQAKQPSVPTVDQWRRLVGMFGHQSPPPFVDELVRRLNARKGTWGHMRPDRVTIEMSPCIYDDTGRSRAVVNHGRPVTDAARQWEGWGTALKPAIEPWLLVRKPISEGSIARNVLKWGTGALNIDGCRFAAGDRGWVGPDGRKGDWPTTDRAPNVVDWSPMPPRYATDHALGRWPANLYYCPKASTAEREAGCDGLPLRNAGELTNRTEGSAGLTPRAGAGRTSDGRRNTHPTVKPVNLARWLVRLVTPPDGVVIDPFTGSGTTGIAAGLEGVGFAGAELNDTEAEPFARIARARMAWWAEHGDRAVEVWQAGRRAEAERVARVEAGQLELWG